MEGFLYPLCVMAEDAEKAGQDRRQPAPAAFPERPERTEPTEPADPEPARAPETAGTPERPTEQDWSEAAGLVMYFALRGGC